MQVLIYQGITASEKKQLKYGKGLQSQALCQGEMEAFVL